MSPTVALNGISALTNKDMKELSFVPKEVSIFFGSQSGTAECFAGDLCEEATSHGITSEVLDLRNFTPEAFAVKKLVILVVASYGNGEPTENAVDFHRYISAKAPEGAFIGQRFTVMCLGDMNYTKFNQMGIDTDINLERLGGKRFYERGIGDDSQDIAADFENWKAGGLWQRLKKAVAEVEAEGGYREMAAVSKKQACQPDKLPLYLFVGHEEKDGAAKDISDALVEKLNTNKFGAPTRQCLSDRKACEVVKKMPKGGVALVVVDSSPEGLCPAAKKLVRNMTVELEKQGLKDKGVKFAVVTVATCSSAAAQKTQIENNVAPLAKAFDRVGAVPLDGKMPCFIDACDDQCPVLDEICSKLSCLSTLPMDNGQPAKVTMTRTPEPVSPVPAPVAASRTVLLCTGTEAREAARALAKIMPKCSVEDAALVSMAGAARKGDQVVLIVDCHKDGLSDGANGLSTLLAAAPAAMQAQLRKLKFGFLTVVCDTSERDKAEIAKAADPLSKNLAKYGATCVSTHCLDLKDMNDDTMSNVCAALKTSFGMDATPKQSEEPAAPALMRAAAAAVLPPAGTTQVRLAAAIVDLPEEVEADPADVRSRYYFEAEECKITKVRQLRQQPALNEGLSTIEVEMEAKGKLAEYALGGTLSLLPENDPEDILKILSLLSFSDAGVSRALTEADLDKSITFAVGSGVNYKRPFPTPCTLRKALSLYCDLSRPPTKKMLTALSLKMQDAGAKSRVEMLLKDTEMLKSLESSVLCLRMHEFWALMSIDGLDLCEFLLHCPRQKAREFTIASSPAASPGKIGLCVALTSHEQPSLDAVLKTLQEKGLAAADTKSPERSQRFFGACSSWLNSRLKSGAAVFAKTHASPLTLPKEDVPIIMIGAGAGVAPFKGFWDELRKSSKAAPAMLFFGCRHPDKDWLFRDEMNGAVKMGAGCGALARMKVGPKRPLAAMYPAFSRPDNESEKKYVQDQLREQAGMVTMAIENKGYIFICGSSAMGKAVLDTLGETIEGGKEAVEDLRKNGRIVAEMWG